MRLINSLAAIINDKCTGCKICAQVCPTLAITMEPVPGSKNKKLAVVEEERFIITHFFNPPQLVPIVEIARFEKTDENVVQTTYDLMKEIGKSPVVLKKEITGFIVNRVQVAFLRECFNLIEQGVCTAEDIDIAVKGSMGFKWAFCGPLESQDLAGLETTKAMVYNIEQDLSNVRDVPSFLKEMVENEQFGIRSNKGFYEYDDFGAKAIHTRDDHFLDLLKLQQQKAKKEKTGSSVK